MHRSTAALVLAIALGSAGPLRADGMPWDADQALLKQAWSAMQSQGIQSVAPFAPRIEQALTDAQLTYRIGDTTYVLVDGVGEGMIASTVASSGKNASGTTVTIDSPYPMLGLLLGSYYDEIGKSDDAVRVIDLALSKHAVGGIDRGAEVVRRRTRGKRPRSEPSRARVARTWLCPDRAGPTGRRRGSLQGVSEGRAGKRDRQARTRLHSAVEGGKDSDAGRVDTPSEAEAVAALIRKRAAPRGMRPQDRPTP
jgi:hypothetical protein